ncbi:MAG TPA: copper homeostasis protein CutC [Microbacteriaceae bacterium]
MPGSAVAVEIAVQDLEGVRIALGEGADTVELCAALGVGGLTPSAGVVELAAELARDAGRQGFLHVLVRPRPGGFYYTGNEIDVILRDIRQLRELGADGIVTGVLDERGQVDIDTMHGLVDAAGPIGVTFHRAIDVAPHPVSAVEKLAQLGVRRVLSSGQAKRSVDGVDLLCAMTAKTAGRVNIIAGGNVAPSDIPVLAAAGVHGVHLSARHVVVGTASGPGGGDTAYDATDVALVRSAVEAARRHTS